MARAPLAAASLLLLAGAALATLDCTSLTGCAKCKYDERGKKGLQLVCTECASEAYTLKEKKGRCDCAAGHFSRFANGTRLGRCTAAPHNAVAAAGKVDDNDNILRHCLANSEPDADKARCVCKAGYFALVLGQTPRCALCGPGSYTDEANTRVACKLCAVGKIHNAEHTGCVGVMQAVSASRASALPEAVVSTVKSTAADAGVRLNSTLADVKGALSKVKAPHAPKLNLTGVAPKLPALKAPKLPPGMANFTIKGAWADALDNVQKRTGFNITDLKFNGTIPPLKDVPGLEHGASGARDALGKLAKGLAGDKNVQDLFLKTIPQNIKEALDTVNAIAPPGTN